MILPALSGLATTALGAGFFALTMLDGTFTAMRESQSVAFYAWLFCWYVVQYFVVIFFNTALVGAAIAVLDGDRPTVGAALKLALSRMSVPRTPMVGSLPACCARAASGHATVIPPSADMNSRLPILIVMVRSDAIGPSRHVSTRSLTVAFGGLCCKTQLLFITGLAFEF